MRNPRSAALSCAASLAICSMFTAAPAQSQVYGALATGEYMRTARGIASWAWIDSTNEAHALVQANSQCNTPQPNPFSPWRDVSLPQVCKYFSFQDAGALVVFRDGQNRLVRTNGYQAPTADIAARYALNEACRYVPAGTVVSVHWARNSQSPYPRGWRQDIAGMKHSAFEVELTCGAPQRGRAGGA